MSHVLDTMAPFNRGRITGGIILHKLTCASKPRSPALFVCKHVKISQLSLVLFAPSCQQLEQAMRIYTICEHNVLQPVFMFLITCAFFTHLGKSRIV